MSPVPSYGQKLKYWLIAAISGMLWGGAIGSVCEYGFNRISLDYEMVKLEQLSWGIRYGFLIGTIIAALHIMGNPVTHNLGRIFFSFLLVTFTTATSIIFGAIIARFVYLAGLWSTSGWQLANPTRHATLIGAMGGRDVGVIFSICILAIKNILTCKLNKYKRLKHEKNIRCDERL